MFRLDPDNIYRSDVLERFSWLDHGFGTRSSAEWPGRNIATLRQIHSSRVIFAHRSGDLGEGDALVSNIPGIALTIRTADCLPILIADPENRAVAAVHAGWRGTAEKIVLATLETMAVRFGTNAANVAIAIGPGIGECCYEVGPEVAASILSDRGGTYTSMKIDLAQATIRQLRRNGGTVGHIDPSGLCTRCLVEHFHSYRRDREQAGRMRSAISIRP